MANINLFEVFIAVADKGNITKASQHLFISQPAVTKSIKQLESELGGKLFIRKNKGVELTVEGKYVYNKVKPLIKELENVYQYFSQVKKLEAGVLRVGTATSNVTILLSTSLNEFIVKYPFVEIKIKRAKEATLIGDLVGGELDLIVIDSKLKKPNLEEVKKFSVNYSVVGNKDFYNKYKNSPLSREEFASCPLALISSSNTSRRNIDSYFGAYGITLNAKYEMENYGLVLDLIKRGLAIGVVNLEYFKAELEKGEIYKINTSFEIDKREISVVKYKQGQTNPAKDAFIDMLK